MRFSKEWENETSEDAEAKLREFLFELYEKYTAGLFAKGKKSKPQIVREKMSEL